MEKFANITLKEIYKYIVGTKMRIIVKNLIYSTTMLLTLTIFLNSAVINVPGDFPTIKEAVYAAQDGDIIEVENGFYFENNIIINKKIKLKSKNLFGAVIDGSGDRWNSIFLVQAETEISGFILKNAYEGILQRFSPDVYWTAHDLAILNMSSSGVGINDVAENIGRAYLYNILVDNCNRAFVTNDAHGLDIKNCLITNCRFAFSGADHIYFNVSQVSVWNCMKLYTEDSGPKSPSATHRINFESNVDILDPLLNSPKNNDFHLSLINSFIHSEDASTMNPRSFKSLEGLTFNIMGDVYFQIKDYNRAAEFYRNALIIGKKILSPDVTWHAYYGLALSYEIHGEAFSALEHYKKAIEVIEIVRNEFPTKEYKSGFLEGKIEIYGSLINLLFELHQKNPLKGYDREAFYFAEKSKARAFLDELQEASIDLKANLKADLKTKERRILKEISEIQIHLEEPGLFPEKKQKLLAKLEKAENKYKGLIIKIKMENPDYANLLYPQPYGYEQIREKLLNNETALLEYMIGEKYSFAFLATSKNLFSTCLPDPKFLIKLVNNYLNFLTLKETGEFKGKRGSERLFNLLMGAFSEQLGKNIKKIIIVPDGNLNYLPFETLIREGGSDNQNKRENRENSHFLIQDYEISYVPSASSLINILERKTIKKRKKDLLVIANPKPDYPNKFASFLNNLLKPLSANKKSKNVNFIFNFSNLPHADTEAKTIAKFFDKDKKILLLKNEAEERRFKQLNLSDFKIIHFATHGLIDNENWWRSALILLPDRDLLEDGFLQPREIYDLKLNSDLVVLSACQTGKGKLEKGEGIMSLAKVFLNTGSKSVICSLWNVNDKSTAQIMKYFYQCIVEGKTKAQALRLAKIKMINSKYSHPFHWAAFILMGDYDSSIKI